MLSAPPRDSSGEIEPHDHPGIQNADGIIRRISPQQTVLDPKIGGRRLSSLAVAPSSGVNGGMSVDLQREIESAGHDAKVYVSTPPWIGSILFVAEDLRNQSLMVGYDPLPPTNPHHGQVWGKFSKSKQNALLEAATWLVPIADVVLCVKK